jgi:hypothetical protein
MRSNETIQLFIREGSSMPVAVGGQEEAEADRPVKIFRLDASPTDPLAMGNSRRVEIVPAKPVSAKAVEVTIEDGHNKKRHFIDQLKAGDTVEIRDPGTDAWWESKLEEIYIFPPNSFQAIVSESYTV